MKVAKADFGIRFRLRNPKSTSPSPIACFVEYDGKPVMKIARGLKIIPSKWNVEKKKPVTGMKDCPVLLRIPKGPVYTWLSPTD